MSRRTPRIVAGFALVAFVLLAHRYEPAQASALFFETIRSLHGPGFGIVAIVIMLLLRDRSRPAAAYWTAGIISMVLALLAEASQIPGSREAELSDLVVDAIGVVGFLGVAALLDNQLRRMMTGWQTSILVLASVPSILLALAPTVWLTSAIVMRSQAMPLLLGFDDPWERAYATDDGAPFEIIPAPVGWPEQSGNIARLHTAGEFGLMLRLHPYPDWSGYSAVSFVAATTDGAQRRIAMGFWGIDPGDGSKPSRHYRTVMIFPSPTRHCIALAELDEPNSGRRFDLAHVSEVLLGSAKNRSGEELLVDDIRLEVSKADCLAR